MSKWTSLRVRKETYDRLLTLAHSVEDKIKQRVFFWELLEVLMDAWDILPDEEKEEIIETLAKRKVGKVVGEVLV